MSGAATAAPATRDEKPGQPGFSRAAAALAPSYTERSCLSKKRYWSQVDALVMAARCIERGHAGALATYHCGNCAGWHLTRQV